MFSKEVYSQRREKLHNSITDGIVLILGNHEAPMNYLHNTYHFRQDSNFLYFFGIDLPGLVGVIDVDNNKDYVFGNDYDLDDVIWMGPQPTISEQAAGVGVANSAPSTDLYGLVKRAIKAGRKVHFLPPYRADNTALLSELLGVRLRAVKHYVSEPLIKAVVALRNIKDAHEIVEIEKAVDTAYLMHTTAMRMAKAGVVEQEIVGVIEGISLSGGNPPSFPIILTINGQTLHNHYHGNTLTEGRMMVTDAGAQTNMYYASDITRTTPVGGKFSARQKSIYEIVLNANTTAIAALKAGVSNRDMHFLACKTIALGLKELGIMKGNVEDAVAAGAHAMFMPHGLGHMMGLDVHDMEDLGENYVGYDEEFVRSEQFGLAFLRLGKRLETGNVITIEPGTYFIPALIDKWRSEGLHTDFINYNEVEKFRDFGGIRIEDDLLITPDGSRLLGKPIPKTVAEVEEAAAK